MQVRFSAEIWPRTIEFVLYHFLQHLPNVILLNMGCSTVKLRVLNLWVNLVIWKAHNRGPSAGPSAIHIQPMHDIRYYLPDEVDVFLVWRQSDDFLIY